MRKLVKTAVVAALVGAALGVRAAPLVDDFSVGQPFMKDSSTNGVGLSSTVSGASILGGWRDLFVSKYDKPINDASGRGVEIGVDAADPGTLSFNSDSGQKGIGIVRWDGSFFDGFASIDPTGLGGVNLAGAGAGLQVVVTSADLGFPFTVNAYTDAANWTSVTLTSSGPGTFFLPFAAFTALGINTGAGVNFASLGALEAILNTAGAVADVDLQIDMIRPVSEPAVLGLAGMGLMMLAGLPRRQRRG